LADIVFVAKKTQVKFVNHCCAVNCREAGTDELRASLGEGVEAGNARAALRRGVGIVEPVIVKKVVKGEGISPEASIDARRNFIVAKGFIIV
jgi:hypothetical protein